MALAEGTNLYIPKYILDVPWYYKSGTKGDSPASKDALAHHRKQPNQAPVDHSEAKAGTGISDEINVVDGAKTRAAVDYDGKRDRWHGHSAAEWDDILASWAAVKKTPQLAANEDSDDTDYELELEELGLLREDLRLGHIEDPMEKSIRDRRDVPAYIRAINGNEGGKIRLGQDSTVALVSDTSDFVKKTEDNADVAGFKQMQKFAWEQNQEFEAKRQRENYEAQVASLRDPNVPVQEKAAADLDASMEASPTLMMMKARQQEDERKKAGEAKRRKLMEMYGS